ncbi:endospore germination permease [Cytobacillus spongiae]|uniref:GerAB/ArcD/ProY family transporter n=1 Tax=Cytobacillus spongiae TaxID=2901381 RepID=UPI001F2CDE23|nr:endospore germination permease [Cytobacillus spongiae]UII54397.1 endospore germination permease [Cytobacillus spongiae]
MGKHKEKINAKQFSNIVTLFTIGSAVLFLPSILTGITKQDAWISVILSTIIAVCVIWFYSKLANLKPQFTFVEMCRYGLGNIAGTFVAIIFLTLPLFLCTVLLWDIGDFMVTQIIPETPIQAIFALFTLAIIYSVRSGIESIGRTAEIFIPWVTSLFFIMIIFAIPSIETRNILPILSNGIKPVLHGTYQMLVFPYLELSLFLMVAPHLNRSDQLTKSYIGGMLKGAFVLFIITTACLLVLGPDFTTRNPYPVYILGKKVSIGQFLQRIEILIAILWFLSIYFKLAIAFYSFVMGLSQIFQLKDYRTISLPFGMLAIILTVISIPNALFLVEFDKFASGPFLMITSVFIPLILFTAIKVKDRRANQKQSSTPSSSG